MIRKRPWLTGQPTVRAVHQSDGNRVITWTLAILLFLHPLSLMVNPLTGIIQFLALMAHLTPTATFVTGINPFMKTNFAKFHSTFLWRTIRPTVYAN